MYGWENTEGSRDFNKSTFPRITASPWETDNLQVREEAIHWLLVIFLLTCALVYDLKQKLLKFFLAQVN